MGEQVAIFFLESMNILGVVAFAISGALSARLKRFDLFGVVFLAALTATGGGMIRDVLLGLVPPAALAHPRDFLLSVAVGAGVFAFGREFSTPRMRDVVLLFDALGLGVFTAVGAARATLVPQHTLFLAVMTGLITGIGGGVLRDLVTRELPIVLRKEIYATASIVGAVVYYALYRLTRDELAAGLACFAVTFGIRFVAMKKNLNIPRSGDFGK